MADTLVDTTEAPVSAGEFVDALTLFVGLLTFQEHSFLGEVALPDVQDRESRELYLRGVTMLRIALPALEGGLRSFGLKMADEVRVKTRFNTGLAGKVILSIDPTKRSEVAFRRFMALQALLPVTLRRSNIIEVVLNDSRAEMSYKKLCKAVQNDNALARLALVAYVPQASPSGSRFTKWVDFAAKLAGVPLPEIDQATKDTESATVLGSELRTVTGKLDMAEPNTPEEADLSEKRTAIVARIKGVVEDSQHPETVKSTVVTEVTKNGKYVTRAGAVAKLNPQQESAMMATGPILIAAGAGSGKTRLLAAKIVYDIMELGAKPEEVVATSFSRKSSSELFERIIKYGNDAGIPEIVTAGKGFWSAKPTTHSIAAKLLGQYGEKAGFPKRGNLDEGDTDALLAVAIAQVGMSSGKTPESYPQPDPNEDMLAPPGKSGGLVESPEVPTPGVSGVPTTPGVSGVPTAPEAPTGDITTTNGLLKALKTVQRNSPPMSDWHRGFLNDMVDRFSRGYQTIERLSDKQKIQINRLLQLEGFPRIASVVVASDVMSLVAAAGEEESTPDDVKPDLKDVGSDTKEETIAFMAAAKSRWYKTPIGAWFNLDMRSEEIQDEGDYDNKSVMSRISYSKSHLNALGGMWARAVTEWERRKAAGETNNGKYSGEMWKLAVHGAYEWLKSEGKGVRDFDDLLIDAVRVLLYSAPARGEVHKIKHILVDEAQDQNEIQNLMFGLMAGRIDPTTRLPWPDGHMTAESYTLVGDDKQSIYRFRGAVPKNFINSSDQMGGKFKTFFLDTNYRSGKNIVESANKLMEHNKGQIPMTCSAKPDAIDGVVKARIVEDPQSGAAMVADEIESIIKGDTATGVPNDFGVACRTNAEAEVFVLELLKRRIPFRCKINPFRNPTTRAVIAWLNLATLPVSDVAEMNKHFLLAHMKPGFFIDKKFSEVVVTLFRNKNYYQAFLDNPYKDVYSDPRDTNRRRRNENVRRYIEAISDIRAFASDSKNTSQDLINYIITMRGPGGTMEVALIQGVMKDKEQVQSLIAENEGKPVTDKQVKAAAMAPLEPLMGLAGEYSDVNSCVAYIAELQRVNEKTQVKDSDEDANKKQAVSIDTMHGWKGLEKKHMYIPMPEGTFPNIRASADEEGMEEERRLAYVAITRGMDSVTLICPIKNARGKAAGPSRFVQEACVSQVEDADGSPVSWMEVDQRVMAQKAADRMNRMGSSHETPKVATGDTELLTAWGME